MKRILLLGLFLGIGVQLFAQGIDFKPVPFSEALRMAKHLYPERNRRLF